MGRNCCGPKARTACHPCVPGFISGHARMAGRACVGCGALLCPYCGHTWARARPRWPYILSAVAASSTIIGSHRAELPRPARTMVGASQSPTFSLRMVARRLA